MEEILKGKQAKAVLTTLLEGVECPRSRHYHRKYLGYSHSYVSGYFKEEGQFVTFDNTRGECFVEEFSTKEEAIDWCKGLFQVQNLMREDGQKNYLEIKIKRMKKDVKILLDYLWDDALQDYKSSQPRQHIFITLNRLADMVNR